MHTSTGRPCPTTTSLPPPAIDPTRADAGTHDVIPTAHRDLPTQVRPVVTPCALGVPVCVTVHHSTD